MSHDSIQNGAIKLSMEMNISADERKLISDIVHVSYLNHILNLSPNDIFKNIHFSRISRSETVN